MSMSFLSTRTFILVSFNKLLRSSFVNIPKKYLLISNHRSCNECSSVATASTASLHTILEQWTSKFQSLSISEPESSCSLIMAHALGKKTLYNVEKQIILTKAQIERINRLCQLRLSGMPVQYVIGEWDFCDITLKMKAPVLIPRPETEELAKLCIDSLKHKENLESGKILEIGCGTGAITLTLLNTFKNINAVSVDVSSVACELTKENADIIGVSDRLNVIEGDFTCEKVLEELATHGPFDLIVSNPPYLRTEDINNLQTEVRCFEDHRALDGGSDGMNLIKHILLKSTDLLHNKGHLWLEVDPAHPQLITEFIKQSVICKSLILDNVVKDMFGKDRFCHLQRD